MRYLIGFSLLCLLLTSLQPAPVLLNGQIGHNQLFGQHLNCQTSGSPLVQFRQNLFSAGSSWIDYRPQQALRLGSVVAALGPPQRVRHDPPPPGQSSGSTWLAWDTFNVVVFGDTPSSPVFALILSCQRISGQPWHGFFYRP